MLDARDVIYLAIKDSGIKQNVVAERAGMTQQQLNDTVHKRRKLGANEMFAICNVIGLSPNDVFEYCREGV